MHPNLVTNLDELAIKHLDGSTDSAFEQIRSKGYTPFLVYGVTASSIMASQDGIGMGGVVPRCLPDKRYMVVLVEDTPDTGVEISSLVDLIPTALENGSEVSDIRVHAYDGNMIYSAGKL